VVVLGVAIPVAVMHWGAAERGANGGGALRGGRFGVAALAASRPLVAARLLHAVVGLAAAALVTQAALGLRLSDEAIHLRGQEHGLVIVGDDRHASGADLIARGRYR
jgi:hypothetical protein